MTRDEIERLNIHPMKNLDNTTVFFPLVDVDEDDLLGWHFPHPGVCVSYD